MYVHLKSLGQLPRVTSPRSSVSTKLEALSYVERLVLLTLGSRFWRYSGSCQ